MMKADKFKEGMFLKVIKDPFRERSYGIITKIEDDKLWGHWYWENSIELAVEAIKEKLVQNYDTTFWVKSDIMAPPFRYIILKKPKSLKTLLFYEKIKKGLIEAARI